MITILKAIGMAFMFVALAAVELAVVLGVIVVIFAIIENL